MAADREQSIDHINKHLTEWFKALKANNELTIERKCRKLLVDKSKLFNKDYPKFFVCMQEVKNETWENYLRRCRDKKYEKNRGRISINKSTQKQLDDLKERLGSDSYDTLIIVLIDEYKKVNCNKKTSLKLKGR